MLKNAYFLAKIGADTAENEQHFAEILPIGRRVADRRDDADPERGADPACPKGMVDLPLYRGEFGDEVRHLRAAPACDI